MKVIVNGDGLTINRKPDECPFCKRNIEVAPIGSYSTRYRKILVFNCPRQVCSEIFLSYYSFKKGVSGAENMWIYEESKPYSYVTKVFSDDIIRISPLFSEIYNQAFKAESEGLGHICGPGYRKALEFLIKDYLIEGSPERSDEIKTMLLGKCIDALVTDSNIKLCAKRATWLGNDETHYVRKWEDKDITNMKELIDLTIHWISSEIITKRYLQEMP
ncbi:DUF4145 domain-containing protein [Paenibacillus sp. FSL R10-2791]|uniref:DUF4145 domain-containing protein n=1 Tax=Paenibacillus TaxID=44249 RepID=UPI0004F6BF17|nr:DUF4145 domain-containing protein [Paenibacillus odorifer]AIQ73903.1 hypothetical protein PODO_11985 [Paenibacillus odorifer]